MRRVFGRDALVFAAALLTLSLGVLWGCSKPADKSGPSRTAASSPTSPASSTATAAGGPAAPSSPLSLVSISAGAFIAQRPKEYSDAYSAVELLDENPRSNWSGERGDITPQTVVIALAERTRLDTLIFDCTPDYTGACADEVKVEVSDASESAGYVQIADLHLKEGANNQTFAVGAPVPGRWVRLTVLGNHGSKDFIQLNEFRATGEQLTHSSSPDVTGTYATALGDFHIRQDGSTLTGCYSTRSGTFKGGMEGRLARITWCELCDAPNRDGGPGVMVFSPDGKRFLGLDWSDKGGRPPYDQRPYKWTGERSKSEAGSCPNFAGGVGDQVVKEIGQSGRARLYSINFDVDSDRIRPDSTDGLDDIVRALKANPGLKLVIEGHTDATSNPAHNLDLSRRRAQSVRAYLVAGGIAEDRLSTAGYGETRPVAGNDTELGRAQNRRVELARP